MKNLRSGVALGLNMSVTAPQFADGSRASNRGLEANAESTGIRKKTEGTRYETDQQAQLSRRISGTSSFFFELSGATNSTIGSDQIDYVNFRPNRATEWDSTPKKLAAGHQVWTHLSWLRLMGRRLSLRKLPVRRIP